MWISSQWKSLSLVRLFATPWTIQSMQFSRPEYWNGWPFPSPGHLPDPGIEPGSPALQADSLPAELPRKPSISIKLIKIKKAQFRFGPRTVVGSSRWLSFFFSCCVYPLNELKGIRISALQAGKLYHTTLECQKCVVTGPCVCMELIKTPFLIQARLILSAPQSQHHDVVQLGRPGAALTRIRWSRTLYPWGGKDLRVDIALKQNVQRKALLGQPCESGQILEFAKRMKEKYSALSPTPTTAHQVLTRFAHSIEEICELATRIESPTTRFTTIHCHSPRTVFYANQTGEFSGELAESTAHASFKSSGGLFCNSHKVWCCFGITTFLGTWSRSSTHWPLSICRLHRSGSQVGIHRTQVPSGHRILAIVFKVITLAPRSQSLLLKWTNGWLSKI